MSDKCPKCNQTVPLSARNCPVCTSGEIGYPNVRMAEKTFEVAALTKRLDDAHVSAKALGREDVLNSFIDAAAKSSAVMNRNLGALSSWVNSSNPLFLSYHRQVEMGRQPNGTEWDEQRAAAESAINPYCYMDLNYAALTLDTVGVTYYGPYAVILREVTIEDRASVFEENPFFFNKRHGVIAGTSPPAGYRASWPDRGRLAGAKLFSKIEKNTQADEFPSILMDERRDKEDCDFIEVHIYGPVNRAGIDTVVGPRPSKRPDVVLWKQAARALKKDGATVIEESRL